MKVAKPFGKMEEKRKLLQLVCQSDLTHEQWKGLWSNTNNRGVKKIYIATTEWRCILDQIKSRLMDASRASDIAIWMICLMNGITLGTIYDWASMFLERIKEFLTLEHKTFCF